MQILSNFIINFKEIVKILTFIVFTFDVQIDFRITAVESLTLNTKQS